MQRMKLFEKLNRLADERGLSQRRIAACFGEVGKWKDKINDWFNDKRKPSLVEGLALARCLGVPLEYLADDAMDDPPAPELTEDERAVLDLYRALGLSRAAALRALSGRIPEPMTPVRKARNTNHDPPSG
jgi:transcriptional regulator with XRE-family HTH domain